MKKNINKILLIAVYSKFKIDIKNVQKCRIIFTENIKIIYFL